MSHNNINDLIRKYDQPAPRYTSFPTAVQFTTAIGVDEQNSALAAIDTALPVSLYTHIPFCHQLCYYCGCNTTIVHDYQRISKYIALLLREIDLVGAALPGRVPVSRLHFGGGSPNYAKPDDLAAITKRLATYFDTEHAQIDMECDPRLLSADMIAALIGIGVSRVSLGIQDFNQDVQQAINRIQPADMVREQLGQWRAGGIESINFDLIIGLPQQTLSTVQETLRHVCDMRPSRIAVFPYAHVPWMKKHQQLLERFDLPAAQLRFDMQALVDECLTDEGYVAIGIDHYALPADNLAIAHAGKTMQRNFQGYTDDPATTIIGFGQSSISQHDSSYVQNSADAAAYRRAICAGRLPAIRGVHVTAQDKSRRALIEQLMCYFTANLADYPCITPPTTQLSALVQDGLIDWDGSHIRITDLGKPFVRIVAASFDPYFKIMSGPEATNSRAPNRHSKAI